MTEAEWLVCNDPTPMLEFLGSKASERKVRLLFCACCRGKNYPICSQGLAAVAVAEAFADGLAGERVRTESERMMRSLIPDDGRWSAYTLIALALYRPVGDDYPLDCVMMWAVPCIVAATFASSDEVTSMIRDIFSPFHHISIDPAWLAWKDGAISKLAQSIYEHRTFDDLPALANALEEAGCTDAEILGHCRGPGPHVKGCWVVDLVLGKQ